MKHNCSKCNLEFETMDKGTIFNQILNGWLCKNCNELFAFELAALKRDFIKPYKTQDLDNGLFPPPWDFVKYPEKTEGWVEFQREMKRHPKYYLGNYNNDPC